MLLVFDDNSDKNSEEGTEFLCKIVIDPIIRYRPIIDILTWQTMFSDWLAINRLEFEIEQLIYFRRMENVLMLLDWKPV